MNSNPRKEGKTSIADELWNKLILEEKQNHNPNSIQQQPPKITVKYQRNLVVNNPPPIASDNSRKDGSDNSRPSTSGINASRVSFVPNNSQRVSWNRSLSTRGRTSIAVIAASKRQGPQKPAPRRKNRPPIPKGTNNQLPNFEKELAYFQEVDAEELLEESPSPKKCTWFTDNQPRNVAMPQVCTRLEKWLHAKRRHETVATSLSTILRTPAELVEPIPFDKDGCGSSYTCSEESHTVHKDFEDMESEIKKLSLASRPSSLGNDAFLALDKDFEDMESEIKKLSLASRPSSLSNDAFFALLKECGQSTPSTLLDVFSNLCDPGTIVKIGEGTYGEAFIAGDSVCKIVPIDGELKVNGEVQKRSIELLEEVILSSTLNHLRGTEILIDNATTTFIETKDIKVCRGPYDPVLVKAWETWDAKHGSENDHPELFPEQQCYVVSILENGGKDLESFILKDFNEAHSLLAQATAALAVAEAAFEFEHRDLHWGNILLSRKDTTTLPFTLEGKTSSIKTHGLLVSIIDFTLSRINTGNTILYLDLSLDPELFEGPKGNKQSETYRRMREVTDDCWDGSVPKTNVLWLQYLVDMLLLKKSFKRSAKDERELRSLKKRLNDYDSAKEALADHFFSELILLDPAT